MYFEYRSIEDMNKGIVSNLFKFPQNIDLIVGVPRSGMLPANLLALYLNKPYTDIDSFLEGRVYSTGQRGKYISKTDRSVVLIIDDSVSTGYAICKVKEKLKNKSLEYNFIYSTVFVAPGSEHLIDIYCEVVHLPRVFQWNLFHHKQFVNNACFDIDGVLCVNPPIDDDGEQYISYLKDAIPYIIPSHEIDTLVTCRLEKYREITENWLNTHHVRYKHLIMLNFNTKAERISWGKHGEYKGQVYKDSKNLLFVESSLSEAMKIAEVSNKIVYCTENFQMIYPHKTYNKFKGRYLSPILYNVKVFLYGILKKYLNK